MALSKKQLKELKSKLQEKDQNAIANIRKAKGPTQKQVKKTIRAKDLTQKKSVIRWNYKVNDLVRVTYGNGSIGLIISNFEYFSEKVEKNCFFVLIDNAVKQIDGRYIRQI